MNQVKQKVKVYSAVFREYSASGLRITANICLILYPEKSIYAY